VSGEAALFLLAGLAGGAVNVAAGGAKLFVFPLLLAAGLPPVAANATATLGLWPAQVPGAVMFRRHLSGLGGGEVALAAAGAVLGAGALILLGEAVFVRLVPLFLAIAVAAILAGERLARLAARFGAGRLTGAGALLLCGIYAGYFGAGLGFLLIAALTLAGRGDIHAANAQKNLLATLANTAAVIPLAASGLIHWKAAVLVLLGGLAGGALGARIIRRLPARPLRLLIATLGVALSAAFLARNG